MIQASPLGESGEPNREISFKDIGDPNLALSRNGLFPNVKVLRDSEQSPTPTDNWSKGLSSMKKLVHVDSQSISR